MEGYAKSLKFIFNRMVKVHGENPDYDYMYMLKKLIAIMESVDSLIKVHDTTSLNIKPSAETESKLCGHNRTKIIKNGSDLYSKCIDCGHVSG